MCSAVATLAWFYGAATGGYVRILRVQSLPWCHYDGKNFVPASGSICHSLLMDQTSATQHKSDAALLWSVGLGQAAVEELVDRYWRKLLASAEQGIEVFKIVIQGRLLSGQCQDVPG